MLKHLLSRHPVFLVAATVFLSLLIQGSAWPADNMSAYYHLKNDDTIQDIIDHPAFKGFGQHLLTRDSDIAALDMPISRIHSLLPYHGFVDGGTVVGALNYMIDDAAAGQDIFYDFYSDQQKKTDPGKRSTGLFFFRGQAGAPFALICPGGGFSYVGSIHEGFPYAMELSKKGYNAFVLRYRTGQGGDTATRDLAAALTYIFNNAEALEVSTSGYSLWGSSAGARMAAAIASHGAGSFGGDRLPGPSAIVMAYTGYSGFSKNDPPTFITVSADDGIVSIQAVERRVLGLRKAGIYVEYLRFRKAGHGFGLGTGTDAEGWIYQAIRFWEKHLPV